MKVIDNPQIILGELCSYSSIQNWIVQLQMGAADTDNGNIPFDTLMACKHAMVNYLNYRKASAKPVTSPDELIEEANLELRTTGKVSTASQHLKFYWARAKSKTVARQHFAMLKGFYRANEIPIIVKTPALPKIRKATKKPLAHEIRSICDVAPIQHKTWIMVSFYCGLRIGAVNELMVEDFQVENWTKDQPLYPVYISQQISGTFSYTAYIGHDAMLMLKSYFNKMGFSKHSKPWDYDRGWLNKMFKKYAYQAKVIDAPFGLDKEGIPKGLSPLHSHCMRMSSQTLQESCGTNTNWVDHLHGHIPRGANGKNYSFPADCTPEDLYNEVLKCLPKKEIYGHHELSPTTSTVELQKLKAIQDMRLIPGMTDEKLSQIQNLLKHCRLISEVQEVEATAHGLVNTLAIPKVRIE